MAGVSQAWRKKEFEAVRWLRAHGFDVDHRSAASHGRVDILAFGTIKSWNGSRMVTPVYLVQVKYVQKIETEWRDADWKELTGFPWPDYVNVMALIWVRGRKEPVIQHL